VCLYDLKGVAHGGDVRRPAGRDQELPIVPAVFSVFLNILFGGNAVAIKFSLEGMGP